MLLQIALFIDLLMPVSVLSKNFQREDLDIVSSLNSLRQAKEKIIQLKHKETYQMASFKFLDSKLFKGDDFVEYQNVRFKKTEFDNAYEQIKTDKEKLVDMLLENLQQRLEGEDDIMFQKIAKILDTQNWNSLAIQCEKEEFADDDIVSLLEHFYLILVANGVDIPIPEMLYEWHNLVYFVINYLNPVRNEYRITWKVIFSSPKAKSNWKNILILIEILLTFPEMLTDRLFRNQDFNWSVSVNGNEGTGVSLFDNQG
ncbi:hypothetical protein LOTGIDRAFT_160949 [Lottia gigantea]|uniref:Uncharacterized protein n=1 Tax=Lottia gigantea TaxID=225164 RepID=V4AM79_LOTGI|nr:hypothetical protein LOTGIDRAFT_160949 [Lottia gigantea]ESO94716.1 hypothetical protein LOTGIDRAFT_160949 [Lottia gigantea]